MTDQNFGTRIGDITPNEWERDEKDKGGSTAVTCLVTFLGTAAATLMICGLIPVRPISEKWHRIVLNRAIPQAKGKVKRASAGAN